MGDHREQMGVDTWNMAMQCAESAKHVKKPFYIIYAAKEDVGLKNSILNGKYCKGAARYGFFGETQRPQPAFGQIVWFVDNAQGIFEFIPELSLPPDIPLEDFMLSGLSEDQLIPVMEKGKQFKALVS